MTDLDLYSEIVAEDDEKRLEYLCSLDVPEHVRSLQTQSSLLEAEVEALNAHVSRLEKERLVLIAKKDQITDNFFRLGLACRREIEKLKSQIKLLCTKLLGNNPSNCWLLSDDNLLPAISHGRCVTFNSVRKLFWLRRGTGPDSSCRGHVPNHLLKAVEGAIRLSRDHHTVRRQHNAANSIHRNRYSKHLHRNYQTHTEISRLESGDCSSEPERRTREASCTLYTKRLRCKGDSTNMIVESTSRDPNDSGHKPDKESDQLTSNENATPNALIPDSSNTVGDIHLLRDYSAQEIVHDSNEQVTNSVNPSDQSSNQFLPKNASFSSIENKIGELVIPEVLGLTPPISNDQDCVEDKTDSPLTSTFTEKLSFNPVICLSF
ncbi:hypothetical protein Smp_154030 [Schistosoma mansoni]|uniref:hypothetical protein n=1 Tax=Schistosoma mansoni TaxID=6183 RepID=UPI0001A64250|nr:hypothetical protein Smp_154030 [Schistosoma mansoni]|eukprot:XP_018654206.1 hypothetical protein Smp_154030 [Schistosoma mansoni]